MTGPVVVKLGGNAVGTADDLDSVVASLAGDLAELLSAGVEVVVVHGAGPQISRALRAAGVDAEVIDGLRVTSEAAVAVVADALAGVNGLIVDALERHGVRARSILGRHGLVHATERGAPWGRVGRDVTVDLAHLDRTEPVVSVIDPVATDEVGHLLNCNADAVAGALAGALDADVLVLLSDVDQVRADVMDPSSALASITRDEVETLRAAGGITGGMIPKVDAALAAVDAGARRVVITAAREPGTLARAIAGEGVLTEVRA